MGNDLYDMGTNHRLDASQSEEVPYSKLWWIVLAGIYPAEPCITGSPYNVRDECCFSWVPPKSPIREKDVGVGSLLRR